MPTRAEHRRATLLALSAATTAEITAQGLDASIDDIAARAGVSRRTVYRWVDSRDELVFIHPRLWLDVFDDAIAEVSDASARDRIRHASRAVSNHIDTDPQPVIDAMLLALEHPTLMRGYAVVSQEWVDRMASEVLDDPADADARFRARVLGSAIMGVIDAALAAWLENNANRPIIEFVEEGLNLLSPVFEE